MFSSKANYICKELQLSMANPCALGYDAAHLSEMAHHGLTGCRRDE